jgi:exodeoxyribonuclease-5
LIDKVISPTAEQSAAIKSIEDWYKRRDQQEFYLAGFAGVGKSTIVGIAIEEIKAKHRIKEVRTAAYTGKAASVLRRKGNEDAQTIHSLIYRPKTNKKTHEVRFTLAKDSAAADADLIVLDECSMVDEKMADDLRSFGKKILIMGDPGQLPPVKGQGAFTSRQPDAFLSEIHRQAADSPILELATLARLGKSLPRNYLKGDVRVLPLNKDTQPLIYREDTQPICGLNRVRWVYNSRIRTQRGFEGHLPQSGERVICCRNNHAIGIFNGVMGKADRACINPGAFPGSIEMDVSMEDSEKPINGLRVDPHLFNNHFNNGTSQKIEIPKGEQRLDEFDFGYVITAHKSQGSQFPHVTVIDDSHSFRENQARWLYTSLTRAETGLTVLLRDAA